MAWATELTPLRIPLGHEGRRWVELQKPTSLELVEGEGVRLETSGRVRWTWKGMGAPLRLRRVRALIAPRIVEGGTLVFPMRFEHADLVRVPRVIEEAIRVRVEEVLASEKTPLRVELARFLDLRVPVRALERSIHFDLTRASVYVRDGAVQLRVEIDAAMEQLVG
ncbi:MAG: hypothetical protein H6721_06570 [Sandaracinus sp.]|nr:hypothetical protein [Sandaracinus sp.]MCB9631786.1 hypothetical protein [Sandaracinus sp.]